MVPGVTKAAILGGMEHQARVLLAAQGGVVGASQLSAVGASAHDVHRWVARGDLVRVRRGAFVDGHLWATVNADARYRLTVKAVMRARAGSHLEEAASHHSALALHGLPLWRVDRRLVVISGDVQQSTTAAGLRLMPLRSLVAKVQVEGVVSLAEADAVVTSASVSEEAGVVAADAAVHRGTTTMDELEEARQRLLPGLRGKARLRRAMAAVDPRAESPGETRTRLLLTAFGMPVESQVVVRDEVGELIGRVDFLVGGRVVVEFDGAVKYGGAAGREALVAEKRREDRLRSQGYEVVRLTWDDLAQPAKVMARVRAALLRHAA